MTARSLVIGAALLIAPSAATAKPFALEVDKAAFDGPDIAWKFACDPKVECVHDAAVGHTAAGSLRVASSEGTGTWTKCVAVKGQAQGLFRVTGHVRTRGVDGAARLLASARDPHGPLSWVEAAPVAGSEDWLKQAVGVGVPAGADQLCLGLRLDGKGKAWLDDVVVERFPEASGRSSEPLTDQAVDNLVALARLWGAVRFFHPDVDALGVDMDAALINAVADVEAAADRVRLEGALRRMVLPLGGSVRIGDPPIAAPPPSVEPEGEDAVRLVPGGELADLGGITAVYLDLRGGAPLPREQAEQLLAGKGKLPDVRRLRYLGFGDRHDTFERKVVKDRLPPFEGGDGVPEVWILTDGFTDPAAGPAVKALRDSGQGKIVGAWVPVWPYPPMRLELAPGLVAQLSLGSIGPTLEADVPCSGSLALGMAKDARAGKAAEWTVKADEPPALPDEPLTHYQRHARLADVIAAWSVLAHFYPYWDQAGADWDAALEQGLREAAVAPDPEASQRALSRLVARARDGHAWVAAPGSAAEGQVPGVGLEVVDGRIVVASRSEAAEAAGVVLGHEVLSADGKDLQALFAAELAVSHGATEAARQRQALDRLLARRPGQVKSVTLGLSPVPEPEPEPPAEPEPPPKRRRGKAVEPEPPPREVTWALPPLEVAPGELADLPARPVHEVLESGYHYVRLVGLDLEAWEGLQEILEGAPGLVLDLRGTPGTAIEAVVGGLLEDRISSPLMDVPVIGGPFAPVADWQRSQWYAKPGKPRIEVPAVVLVDERAVGAAETWLSVLAHSGQVTLVGSPSAGTNGTSTRARLPAGSNLGFTGMRVLDQSGGAHHGVGVVPDVEVERTLEGIVAGRDEVLEAGIEALINPPIKAVREPEPPARPEPEPEPPVRPEPDVEPVPEAGTEVDSVTAPEVEPEEAPPEGPLMPGDEGAEPVEGDGARPDRAPLSERAPATEEEEEEEEEDDPRKRGGRKKKKKSTKSR